MVAPTSNTDTCPSLPPLSPSAASPIDAVSAPLVLPLSSVKLTDTNYHVWRRFMMASLTSNRATRKEKRGEGSGREKRKKKEEKEGKRKKERKRRKERKGEEEGEDE
ncbi:hypothetical protein Lal_00031619 [Lupinus albus]|nr:hypothetical protein Lal_00031619 [Lupinus albus]